MKVKMSVSQLNDDTNGHPSFTVGSDSQEQLNEIHFSMMHHQRSCGGEDFYDGNGATNIYDDEQMIPINPLDEPGVFSLESNIGDLIGITRVDSQDIVFDNRVKKAKIINHYLFGDVLGEGSYAKVKEVIDTRTLYRRAIKIMKQKKLKRIPKGEENVEREIQMLRKLKHRNVMELIEVFRIEEKQKIYLVLEFCCGVLNDMIEKSDMKRLPTWQAHFYFKQLIEGLEYLHSKNVIHKDIKPGNLLVNIADTLKIADFGVAEVLDRYAIDDTIYNSQGTPAFQAPEIANGCKSFPGFKVDVWSSGITLFNFVTGTYPFSGDTIFRLFEDIGQAEFEMPQTIDNLLQDLIRGMLRKDPYQRFSIQDIRHHDWFRKHHPQNCPAVPIPPRKNGDSSLTSTVFPYLLSLYCDSNIDIELNGETLGVEETTTSFSTSQQDQLPQLQDDTQFNTNCYNDQQQACDDKKQQQNNSNTHTKDKTTKCTDLSFKNCIIS